MTDLLILCLWFMLQFEYRLKVLATTSSRKEAAKTIGLLLLLFAPTLLGLVADIAMNNTTVPLVLGGGWFKQWTFSTRLETLCVDDTNPFLSQDLCIHIALAINRVSPTHDHIKAVLPKAQNGQQ